MRETASKAEVQSQQSWCTLCELIYGGKVFTDELWLRTIRGRDYLVCKVHLKRKRGKYVS